jgi:hypothetical protein
MPQRPFNLDPGYDTVAPPKPPQEVENNESFFDWAGNVAGTVAVYANPQMLLANPFARQQVADTVGAVFRLENPVVAAVDLMTRPAYESDPTFDVEANLKAAGMWEDYRWNYLGVNSAQEFLDVTRRIQQEEKDRALVQSAGAGGVVAAMFAGLLSPTALLPFVGQLRGLKALGTGAAWGFAGGAIDEIPLQMAQETRTLDEGIFAVAASTVLSGVLGGAVGYLAKPLDDAANDMVRSLTEPPIPSTPFASIGPKAASVGAEAAEAAPRAGGLKSALGQEKELLGGISPVTRVLRQEEIKTDQWIMAQLSDAGLALEGNAKGIATAVGGTAENNILTHWAKAADVARKLDDAFARYMLGKQGQSSALDRARSNIASIMPGRTKMSKSEFRRAVGRAMYNGDQHEIGEVAEVAAFTRKRVYEKLYEEGKKAGVFAQAKSFDDAAEYIASKAESYLNRDYNLEAIKAERPRFMRILSTHYANKLGGQFQQELEKLLARTDKDSTRLADIQRPEDEVKALQKQFTDDLAQLDAARTEEQVALDDYISDLRSLARDKKLSEAQRKDARDMAKMLEETGGAGERQATRRALKQRLQNLNRSFAVKNQQLKSKLDKIGRSEELSLNTMKAAIRKAQKFLGQLDQLSDEGFAKEISELKNRFAAAADQYDKGEERIGKLLSEPDDNIDDLLKQEGKQQDRAERLTNLADELGNVEDLDRESLRLLVNEALDEALAKTNRINGRRFSRAERLKAQVAELDPKKLQEEVDKLRRTMDERTAGFFDKWQASGAKSVQVKPGFIPDFNTYAEDIARRVTERILGTNARIAGMDLVMEGKGAELARVLDIDSNLIMDFLDTDIEHLVSQYIRTIAPDIEIRKKLGDYAPGLGERNYEFQKRNEEVAARSKQLEDDMRAAGKSDEEIKKAQLKFSKQEAENMRDISAVIGRLRHEWGLPKDPLAMSARLGRVAMNLNVLRYMGMVTVSSLPDLAAPVMKYGMMRTFRDGWVPFVKQLAGLRLTSRELRLAGSALDLVLHSRARAISDIGDYMVRGSKFEKGLEWTTSKIGLVALFDYWTTAMKQITGSVANAKIMDDIRLIMEGGGNAKDRAKAADFLASAGINEDLARSMWKEITTPGGSDIVDGVLWPNTEAWSNAAGAVDAYRAAIIRETNRTIVTPGVERPLMSDSSLPGKLLFQFKSFALSSTTKVLLSGLQQRDMAVATGSVISLALGGLSYYIWANVTGGKALEDLNAALDDFEGEGWKKFMDEAISRSGILASLSMGQDIMSTLPMDLPVNFSGQRNTRQADNDFIDAVGGPSVDLLKRMVGALPSEDSETGELEWGQRQARQLRLGLGAFQNTLGIRHIYDAIENAVPENN